MEQGRQVRRVMALGSEGRPVLFLRVGCCTAQRCAMVAGLAFALGGSVREPSRRVAKAAGQETNVIARTVLTLRRR